jgi:hypothetical protein
VHHRRNTVLNYKRQAHPLAIHIGFIIATRVVFSRFHPLAGPWFGNRLDKDTLTRAQRLLMPSFSN